MALTLVTLIVNAQAQAVLDLIDGAATPAIIEIQDSGNATLVELTCNDPSFTGPVEGVLTLDVVSADVEGIAIATATADHGIIKDGDDVELIQGLTVGLSGSGANIIMATLAINSGNTVKAISGTYTQPKT